MLNGKSILITGGTGSFGKSFATKILSKYKKVKRLVIFSRDELKQFEMSNLEPFRKNSKKVRFFIGDVRDFDRVKSSFKEIDIVVHAAAMKQVEASEYNPYECIKTNILGSQNIINAALECNLEKVIFISTDKATNPINLYGASKLAGEKLFLAANNIRGNTKTIFSLVRYGNVIGSRGSVIPIFMKCKESKSKFVPITHKDMTRFIITLDGGVNFVLSSLDIMNGGEIFVPKIPSVRIIDLAKIILPNHKIKFIGIRPGEKLHEVLISRDESEKIYSMPDRYIIKPNLLFFKSKINKKLNLKKLNSSFEFSSDLKSALINIDEIKKNFTF
jgi:UDP-N-acetylglucosamine 4,6-dehydratase